MQGAIFTRGENGGFITHEGGREKYEDRAIEALHMQDKMPSAAEGVVIKKRRPKKASKTVSGG